MRIYSIVSAALGGAFMVGVSTTALAGSCGGGVVCNSGFNAGIMPYEGVRNAGCNAQLRMQQPRMAMAPAPNCNPGVVVHPGGADPLAPVNTYVNAPYGYGKNFIYKNTPNVNITRVRSRLPMVNLNDAPTGFTGGCNPASTYCRSGGQMRAPMPMMPRPVMRPVMPRPVPMVMRAPIALAAPVQARVGSGYNPANFAPRQYGNNVLTPGTAHIPTSIVDRSPITHIDGVPQQQVSTVTTVNGTYGRGYSTAARPVARPTAPQMAQRGGNVLGYVNGGSRTAVRPGTPDYWARTSGATVVDGLPATQILCRRAGTPATRHTVNVVRPVIGVPTPVPTAVPVPVRPVCAPAPMPMRAPMRAPMAGGRWTY